MIWARAEENWLELFSLLFLCVVLHLNPDGSIPAYTWFIFFLVLVMILVSTRV